MAKTKKQKSANKNKYQNKPFKNLLAQIESEYAYGSAYMKPKWDEWAARLKLFNNQKRDKKAVGDPLLFTIFETVFAALYDDQLSSQFIHREEGDIDVAENLTNTAKFDYSEMEKDRLDHDWIWDTMFFGRGLVDMEEFDRDIFAPIPYVIDPLGFIRDPRAISINGDRKGRGRARFCGEVLSITKNELKEDENFFNLDKLKESHIDKSSDIERNKMLRHEAQGFDDFSNLNLKGENVEYRIIKWYTIYKGKRVKVHVTNDFKVVIGYQIIESPDPDKKPIADIPIIDRSMYPMAHNWDGVSIPDLVEDKQRGRAVITNLSLKSVKADTHPMYVFDTNKIKNRNDLNFGFNKHVPSDGAVNNAIAPITRKTVDSSVSFILDFLDTAAQRATATPEIQQGQVSSQKRTLGELQIVERKVDTRYSLSAKIFGWSEKAFWKRWYQMYKMHFKDGIDEKMVRINGAISPTFRPFTRENLIANTDPDIVIKSKVVADAERFNMLRQYSGFIALAITDPNANKRYAMRRLGRLSGLEVEDIQFILPPTVDELKAERENEKLNEDKMSSVDVNDDHVAHMEVHNKAADTAAKYAHIQAHKRALAAISKNPKLQQRTPPSQAAQPGAGQLTAATGAPPQEGANQPSPEQRQAQQAGASPQATA